MCTLMITFRSVLLTIVRYVSDKSFRENQNTLFVFNNWFDNIYRGWTQTGYLNKHYNVNQKDEDT